MSGIHKFLTRRERNKVGKQNKDEASNVLSRPYFNGFFASDCAPEPDQEEQKKLKIIERRVAQLGFTGLGEEHYTYALRASKGDVEKAFDLLLLLEDSIEGIIRAYSPSTKLLGAVNRQSVTCYLDALLFAMFARLDCFEAILYKSFNDEPRRKLSILLRLWVNMLRSGKLITTDITKHLQDALAECGWEAAAELRQQDTSEAFTFITGKLELPLLTLKMDIYHTGKEDLTSDHKFVNERLLEVAIPEPVDGKTVTLEDCLESYFNNRIEVKRYLERRNTVGSTKSFDSMAKGFSSHVETVEVIPSPTSPTSPTQLTPLRSGNVTPMTSRTEVSGSNTPRSADIRRSSIVQERFIPDSEDGAYTDDDLYLTKAHARKGSYRKEVMMPAWQFFSLIPWYTDNTPTSDAQVAAHFSSKRPILGMCLKRYSVLANGRAVRLGTYVDIPTEIGLPHFIQDDKMDEEGPIYGNFKLSLQALVCHRGNSVDSGHYIAIVRGSSVDAPPASSRGSEPAPDAPRYWMRFDDLAEERVTLVDIEQALKTESPYLLFYQILPINEDAADANLATKSASSGSSEDVSEIDAAGIVRRLQTLSTVNTDIDLTKGSVSGRPSLEITTPADPASGMVNGKKPSVAFSGNADSTNNLQVHHASSTSPRIIPKDSEGKAPLSNSRRGSRSTRSAPGSRTESQAGESRISATFSRFTGRRSKDKYSSDGSADDDVDEFSVENVLSGQTGEISPPTSRDGKEKSPRRTKDRERSKGKLKDKSREKFGRKLERECIVM